VPEAAVDKDCEARSREEDVDPDADLGQVDQGMLAKAIPRAVQS
jgi:hypothetical protein